MSPNGSVEPQIQRASQACMTCRKQKRKCNKALPSCSLCERMKRVCDYSDAQPPPTPEDFNALRMKVSELESRLNLGPEIVNSPTPFTTSLASTLVGPENLGPPIPAYLPPQESPWQTIQNRFPAIAFLDRETFTYGRIEVPKPVVAVPMDVLELLGDGASVQTIITEYYATIHHWMPIVSKKRMTRNMANPMWEAGPDIALLFLCMKLITSRPQDGMESSQTPAYISAKRFLALMEATGMISLGVLQAGILIALFEYGQAIYPAAWMSAGWCIRYGTMLGLNDFSDMTQLLGRVVTWTEQEERRRSWWAVLLVDRMVSIGSQDSVLTITQEPKDDDPLPLDDTAWNVGERSLAGAQRHVSSSFNEPFSPFPRLCQASIMMGKVLIHHTQKERYQAKHYEEANTLYGDVCSLARIITDAAFSSDDYLSLASPLALSLSTLFALCNPYSCTTSCPPSSSHEAAVMMAKALDGLKTVSSSTVEFAEHINNATPLPEDMDRVSPLIMDALYSAASSCAWMVRESGDEKSQMALDSIRHSFRRLSTRWRNAAEYLRVLEAQEFTFAIGSAGA